MNRQKQMRGRQSSGVTINYERKKRTDIYTKLTGGRHETDKELSIHRGERK